MWVHDHVWADAEVVEWHVLLLDNEPSHSLLSVPAGELVPQLRTAGLPEQHFDEGVIVRIGRHHHFLHVGGDRTWKIKHVNFHRKNFQKLEKLEPKTRNFG